MEVWSSNNWTATWRPLKKEEMEEMNNLIGILAMVNRQPEKNDKKNLETWRERNHSQWLLFKQSVKSIGRSTVSLLKSIALLKVCAFKESWWDRLNILDRIQKKNLQITLLPHVWPLCIKGQDLADHLRIRWGSLLFGTNFWQQKMSPGFLLTDPLTS